MVHEELQKADEIVSHILELYPETRDCDRLLYLAYIAIFFDVKKKLGPENYALIKRVVQEGFHYSSIMRTRQKLQHHGLFRGKKYYERHNLAEDAQRSLGYDV